MRPEDILCAKAVRVSTGEIYDFIVQGQGHWNLNSEKLMGCAQFVAETIRENYPQLEIPYHSRWRHFDVGGTHRSKDFLNQLSEMNSDESLMAQFELIITSVLLDAGAGSKWSYREGEQIYSRSEGLAVASLHMFLSGAFSHLSNKPLMATAEGLKKITPSQLEAAFQVTGSNPLVGVSGRVQLLKNLGATIEENEKYFPGRRLGGFAVFIKETLGTEFKSSDFFKYLLKAFSSIWPSRLSLEGQNLGDVWRHPASKTLSGYVAFHKLSQWLTYSLIESLQISGFKVNGLDELTGLAEYRNGGLFVDLGVISPKNPKDLEQAHLPSSEFVIEWRALTVQLLDRLAQLVRTEFGYSEDQWPLVKILEGGTWAAGRRISSQLRPQTNEPPVQIQSDGTVF